MTTCLFQGDARDVLPTLPSGSVHLVMTSPPYMGLRSYLPAGHPDKANEIGSEPSPAAFVAALVEVFREVRRVLRPDGLLVCNLGDGYAGGGRGGNPAESAFRKQATNAGSLVAPSPVPDGMKPKDLLGIPFAVAMALRDDGWYWRSCLPWVKRSCMPESVTDRPTSAIEYVMLFSKSPKYYWDAEAVRREAAYGGEQLGIVRGKKRRAEAMGVTPSGNERPGADATIPSARNFRNSDLLFDSLKPPFGLICDADGEPLALDVNAEPTKLPHYAAYPSKLVVPFVKAGTSERGVCAVCGAPWVRQVERTAMEIRRSGRGDATGKFGRTASSGTMTKPPSSTTTGWAPSCTCNAGDPVPATVLDPFAGICTTLLVANRMGRDAIGIELSEQYVIVGGERMEREANGAPK